MQLINTVRKHVRATAIGGIVGLVLVASVASAATTVLEKAPPKQAVKGAQFTKGAKGATGAKGVKGVKGDKGAKGDRGEQGSGGPQGSQGSHGSQGQNGKDADEEYGIAIVNVQRGTGGAAPWAVYSTELGSPMGDSTGGTFRFTCRSVTNTVPDGSCKVSIAAKILSDSSTAPGKVYPRILIHRGGSQNSSVEPMLYCEYGDGPESAITRTPKSDTAPSGAPVNVHIGGSADCNGPDATAGSVAVITVPEGYYDVWSSFTFRQS